MIRRDQVELLERFDGGGANVLSAYLDVEPERRRRAAYTIVFRDLVRDIRERLDKDAQRDLAAESAPNQTTYFMKIAAEGGYDGTIFHRMIPRGMIQGGDPLSKDPSKRATYGTGGLNVVTDDRPAPKMTRGSVAAVTVPGKHDSGGAQWHDITPPKLGAGTIRAASFAARSRATQHISFDDT